MSDRLETEADAAEKRAAYFRQRAKDHERQAQEMNYLADDCAARAALIRRELTGRSMA